MRKRKAVKFFVSLGSVFKLINSLYNSHNKERLFTCKTLTDKIRNWEVVTE
jgi:hypothetical protein